MNTAPNYADIWESLTFGRNPVTVKKTNLTFVGGVPKGRVRIVAREGWQRKAVEELTAKSATYRLYQDSGHLDHDDLVMAAIDYAARLGGLDVEVDGDLL